VWFEALDDACVIDGRKNVNDYALNFENCCLDIKKFIIIQVNDQITSNGS